MSVGKLGSSWKTLRLGGGGVRGGFSFVCLRSCGVVGGVIKLCRARGVSRPLACRGRQVSAGPSQGLGAGESEAGRADTETERGPWALLPGLPSWVLPGGQGGPACERVSEGPEPLSRRASDALQPESSLCSPPVGQEVASQMTGAREIYRGGGQGPERVTPCPSLHSALAGGCGYRPSSRPSCAHTSSPRLSVTEGHQHRCHCPHFTEGK